MAPGRRPEIRVWEAAGAALALLVGFHFLALRVRAGGLPGGDEGSWLSVAAELARGHGFSTRWLECHFLEPYSLPRPDDFRYPALTSLLALAFGVFGISVDTARWTVTSVFLAMAVAAWLACRSAFGRWTGMAALWLTACSLLQLQWNSVVYTEGLFGLVAAGLAWWSLRGDGPRAAASQPGTAWRPATDPRLTDPVWWCVLGAGVGLLYLVRPNALLFLPGILWLFWRRRHLGLTWKHPACAFACFLLIVSPWLFRTAYHFGNPFHIAGNAGMLREAGQSHTLTIREYLAQHNPWYPLQRFVLGVPRFFRLLHHYEHGLEIIPLIAAAAAVILRRPFFGPFFSAGFLASALVCFYAAYDGWAPVRYMSPLMPLFYAYGLAVLADGARRLATRLFPGPGENGATFRGAIKGFGGAAGILAIMAILLLLSPVVHPHRFYERTLSPPQERLEQPARLDGYLRGLEERVPLGGTYYAGTLCAVNFLARERECVGLQELYDSTWFTRSMAAFHPGVIALTRRELADTAMISALAKMRREGYLPDTLASGPLAVLFSLRPMVPEAGLPPEAAETVREPEAAEAGAE